MKNRVSLFICIFLYFVFIFLFEKIAFMLVPIFTAEGKIGLEEALAVLYNGLPLDLSMSGYLTLIPALFLIISIWIKPTVMSKIFNVYYALILFIVTAIAVLDIMIYPYGDFHFDTSILLYIEKPQEILAVASTPQIVIGAVTTLVVTVLFYLGYNFLIKSQILKLQVPRSLGKTVGVMLALVVALAVIIIGGQTVTTMNVGKAYFSNNVFLNRASANPQFDFMYSFTNVNGHNTKQR